MTTQSAGHEARFKEMDMAGADGVEKLEDAIVRSAEQVSGQIRAAKEAIATVIFGQERVIENTLVTILSGGHALLIGVPGLAKTKLVETLGITLGLDTKRIQFTPDLMPSDILGAEVLFETTGAEETLAKSAMNADALIAAQRLVRRLPVGDSVVETILSLVRSARPGPEGGEAGKLIAWGPGPRASQSLMLAVRARALLDGRLAPSIDDVLDLAEPVLKHRMALTFSARAEGRTIPDIIRQLKTRIG